MPGLINQCNCLFIQWQTIKCGTETAGKVFQPVQATGCLKDLGIQFNGIVCRVDARTTTGTFLVRLRVGGAVRAEEKTWITARGGSNDRLPMLFRFQNGQTVMMRTEAATEQAISIH